MTMAQMDAVHFCRFKSNSPGKLIDTVHESFINDASESSPGSDDALPGCQLKTRRGCVLLQPVRLHSPGVELVNPEQICYKLIVAPYDSLLQSCS